MKISLVQEIFLLQLLKDQLDKGLSIGVHHSFFGLNSIAASAKCKHWSLLVFKVLLPSCPSHCWESVVITLLKMEKGH